MQLTPTIGVVRSNPTCRIGSREMPKSFFCISVLFLFGLTGVAGKAEAQSQAEIGAKTPEALANLVLQRFASGSTEEFSAVVRDPSADEVVARAIKEKSERRANLGLVISREPTRAILLLTGTVVSIYSGEESTGTREFSGIYEAQKSADGVWKITQHIRLDEQNHILSHAVRAAIVPGQRVIVHDDVGISVGAPYGFAVRLNDRAKVTAVLLNGRPAKYRFGGGVLYLKTPPTPRATLSLSYTLAAENHIQDKKTQAAFTPPSPDFGEFLNVDLWMPMFDFDSANDTAPISITARIPAAFYLTTSIPQTETLAHGVRIVRGRTDEPEFTLTLIYDRDWHPTIAKIGGVQFATFLTSDYRWRAEKLEALLRAEYQMLDPRFGPPQSHYLAVVEERGIGESGFRYRANDLVVSGEGGGKQLLPQRDDAASEPSAPFPHEVSHGWTMQATGRAANTLREGWATFCEWMFIGHQYGPDVEREIWETAHNYYLLGGHDGVRSILGNPGNGSIHYTKGAWLFHMLEETMGQSAFDRGIREYVNIPRDRPAGYRELIAALSHASGHDMKAFVMPWLAGKYIPNIDARVDGSQILVTQTQPDVVFTDLPVDLALTANSGATVIRTIHITGRAQSLDVSSLGGVTSVKVDPEHKLLIQRLFGEVARFALRDADAKSVALAGNFALRPVTAARSADTWTLDIPLEEGRYSWAWVVDGKPLAAELNGQAASGVRVVQPLTRLTSPYPK
jgi:hypothetical protein